MATNLSDQFARYSGSFSVSFPQLAQGALKFDGARMVRRRYRSGESDGGASRTVDLVELLIFPELFHNGACLVKAKVVCADEVTRDLAESDSGCGFTICGNSIGSADDYWS